MPYWMQAFLAEFTLSENVMEGFSRTWIIQIVCILGVAAAGRRLWCYCWFGRMCSMLSTSIRHPFHARRSSHDRVHRTSVFRHSWLADAGLTDHRGEKKTTRTQVHLLKLMGRRFRSDRRKYGFTQHMIYDIGNRRSNGHKLRWL